MHYKCFAQSFVRLVQTIEDLKIHSFFFLKLQTLLMLQTLDHKPVEVLNFEQLLVG